jgi:hypothetical protein
MVTPLVLFLDPTNGLHSINLKREPEPIAAAPTQLCAKWAWIQLCHRGPFGLDGLAPLICRRTPDPQARNPMRSCTPAADNRMIPLCNLIEVRPMAKDEGS